MICKICFFFLFFISSSFKFNWADTNSYYSINACKIRIVNLLFPDKLLLYDFKWFKNLKCNQEMDNEVNKIITQHDLFFFIIIFASSKLVKSKIYSMILVSLVLEKENKKLLKSINLVSKWYFLKHLRNCGVFFNIFSKNLLLIFISSVHKNLNRKLRFQLIPFYFWAPAVE